MLRVVGAPRGHQLGPAVAGGHAGAGVLRGRNHGPPRAHGARQVHHVRRGHGVGSERRRLHAQVDGGTVVAVAGAGGRERIVNGVGT